MLPQLRRMAARLARRRAQLYRHPEQSQIAERGMIVFHHVTVGPDLRIVGQVRHRVHDGVDEVAAAFEDSHPLVARTRGEHFVENRDQRGRVLATHFGFGKTWIVDQFGLADYFAEIFPVTIGLQHRQRNPLVIGAAIVVPQRIECVRASVARKFLAHDSARDDVQSLQRHHRTQVRRVDFLPDARALAREQSSQNAVREHDRAHLIGDSAVDVAGRRAAGADRVHDPGARLPQVIERRLAAVGPFGTVAGCARIDDARIERGEFRIAEPQPLRDALTKILHEDVAARGQAMHYLARLGLLQIQRDTLLVLVVGFEVIIAPALDGGTARDGGNSPARVAALALFYLDNFGAEVGEHLRRDRPLLPDRPVDNSNSVKRSAHAFLYTTTLLSLCAAGRINHICPRSPRWPTFCFLPDAPRAERRSRPTGAAYALDASRGSSGCRSRAAKFAAGRSNQRPAMRRDAPDASRVRRDIESRARSRAIARRPRTNPAACPRCFAGTSTASINLSAARW